MVALRLSGSFLSALGRRRAVATDGNAGPLRSCNQYCTNVRQSGQQIELMCPSWCAAIIGLVMIASPHFGGQFLPAVLLRETNPRRCPTPDEAAGRPIARCAC